jgi:hypothetical protein
MLDDPQTPLLPRIDSYQCWSQGADEVSGTHRSQPRTDPVTNPKLTARSRIFERHAIEHVGIELGSPFSSVCYSCDSSLTI